MATDPTERAETPARGVPTTHELCGGFCRCSGSCSRFLVTKPSRDALTTKGHGEQADRGVRLGC